MIERFKGENGKRLLVDALCRQTIVEGRREIAELIAGACILEEYSIDQEILTQGSKDNHVSFIISGSVLIVVNGHCINERKPNQHVGEMALIDAGAVRSASVVAKELTVTANLYEPDFTHIANEFPRLWRLLALELGERLRQRNNLVPTKNEQPIIFVGSSAESLPIAEAILSGLENEPFTIRLWSQGVFEASSSTMEDLERQIGESDFAVLVFSEDDIVISRRSEFSAPRDNVVFELGLCMGAIGRKRTFIVKPRKSDLKIPSDLLGITPIVYAKCDPDDLQINIGPVCAEIKKLVIQKGTK